MAHYTKEQLIERVKPYFKEQSIQKMICTTDGNVFYPEHLSFANAHTKNAKLDKSKNPVLITREEVEGVEKKEVDTADRKEVIDQAKELGIQFAKNIKTEDLQKRIDEELSK